MASIQYHSATAHAAYRDLRRALLDVPRALCAARRPASSAADGCTGTTPTASVLADFDFEPAPSLERERVWRWRQTRGETLVEFLTPSFSADEGVRRLPALGVEAQALHYLNYPLAEPIPAAVVYRSGVLVPIPRPERHAVHKLIVADRRPDGANALTARKDREQGGLLDQDARRGSARRPRRGARRRTSSRTTLARATGTKPRAPDVADLLERLPA